MSERSKYRFWSWISCPECERSDDVSSLANGTEIVLECYSCGLIEEYEFGTDVSLDGLDLDAIYELAADD